MNYVLLVVLTLLSFGVATTYGGFSNAILYFIAVFLTWTLSRDPRTVKGVLPFGLCACFVLAINGGGGLVVFYILIGWLAKSFGESTW